MTLFTDVFLQGTALEDRGAGGEEKQLSIIVAAATTDEQRPDKPSGKIRVWRANRTSSCSQAITFHSMSKVRIIKARRPLRCR